MTTKFWLIGGALVLLGALILGLSVSVKSCVKYKKLSQDLLKERELVLKIQKQVQQSDKKVNDNAKKQIQIIRTIPNSDIVHKLNGLFNNSVSPDANTNAR